MLMSCDFHKIKARKNFQAINQPRGNISDQVSVLNPNQEVPADELLRIEDKSKTLTSLCPDNLDTICSLPFSISEIKSTRKGLLHNSEQIGCIQCPHRFASRSEMEVSLHSQLEESKGDSDCGWSYDVSISVKSSSDSLSISIGKNHCLL
jgi:hypothetical protein